MGSEYLVYMTSSYWHVYAYIKNRQERPIDTVIAILSVVKLTRVWSSLGLHC